MSCFTNCPVFSVLYSVYTVLYNFIWCLQLFTNVLNKISTSTLLHSTHRNSIYDKLHHGHYSTHHKYQQYTQLDSKFLANIRSIIVPSSVVALHTYWRKPLLFINCTNELSSFIMSSLKSPNTNVFDEHFGEYIYEYIL